MLNPPYPFMAPMMGPHGIMPRHHPGAVNAAPTPIMMQTPIQAPEPESLPSNKEALGERLYLEVEKFEPKDAGKITGMLLEMQIEQIHNMLRNDLQLKRWVDEAKEVLNASPA